MRVSIAIVVSVLSAGCVSQLSPTVFRAPAEQATVESVERALAEQGMTADRADAAAGIVHTPWESTGQNTDGTIWAARYVVTIAPAGASARVTVTMDLRTCEHGLGTTPHDPRLDASSCARLPDGTTPVSYQDQLDRFAAALRASLGGT